MDFLTLHRNAIKEAIDRLIDLGNRTARAGDDHFAIFDDERSHYALVKAGWDNGRRVHGTTIFARLTGGKIWIEEDWTEEGIANELVRLGVPRSDIVLGFHPPSVRPQTEFAVA